MYLTVNIKEFILWSQSYGADMKSSTELDCKNLAEELQLNLGHGSLWSVVSQERNHQTLQRQDRSKDQRSPKVIKNTSSYIIPGLSLTIIVHFLFSASGKTREWDEQKTWSSTSSFFLGRQCRKVQPGLATLAVCR